MTTVIKIGDKVIWQPKALEGRKNPLAYMSCKVLALYDDAQGHPAAIIDCGGVFREIRVFVKDLELQEDEPDTTTILSGG